MMQSISVRLSSRVSVTEIMLCLNVNEFLFISRFPRSLIQDDNTIPGKICHTSGINFLVYSQCC